MDLERQIDEIFLDFDAEAPAAVAAAWTSAETSPFADAVHEAAAALVGETRELEAEDSEAAELEDLMSAEDEALDGPLLAERLEESSAAELQLADELQVPAPPQGGAPVVTTLTVSVRTDFSVRRNGRTEFDWIPGEAVRGARVAIVGTAIAAITDGRGAARLNVTGLADGDHVVRITHTDPARTAAGPAGPGVADGLATRPDRIYQPLDVRVRSAGARLAGASVAPGDVHGGIGNRTQGGFSALHLPVDWKPVWMRSPMKVGERARTAAAITLLVVHRTGGPRIGPAINTFVNAQTAANAHYLMDHDGHVVKTAEDLRRANHAGISRWAGRLGVSGPSIGIEIVNGGGAFSAAQMTRLVSLLTALRAAYPTIPSHAVIGHSDMATTDGTATLLSNRRSEDPGVEFDWATLEAAGLGMVPQMVAAIRSVISSVFTGALGPAPAVLRNGDRDPTSSAPAILGGVARPGFTGTPVRSIQEDLEHIGYSTRRAGGALGVFDLHTERAVDRFQRHFFAGRRKGLRAGRLGRVDILTAAWLKAVRAGMP